MLHDGGALVLHTLKVFLPADVLDALGLGLYLLRQCVRCILLWAQYDETALRANKRLGAQVPESHLPVRFGACARSSSIESIEPLCRYGAGREHHHP